MTPRTAAHQPPLFMGFSRQEYLGGHFLLQGLFLTQGSNPSHLALAGGLLTTEPPGGPVFPGGRNYSEGGATHSFIGYLFLQCNLTGE